MAGRQFSFFLAPLDQGEFEAALRSSGDIAFLNAKPLSSEPEEISSSVVKAMGEEPLRILIARRADLANLHFSPIEGRGEYSCDTVSSPIIEFDRCYVTDRYIRAGRLYRVDKFWDYDGELKAKSPKFIDWSNRLYKAAKASLKKVEQGCYAGTEALDLRKCGIAFEGLDMRSVRN